MRAYALLALAPFAALLTAAAAGPSSNGARACRRVRNDDSTLSREPLLRLPRRAPAQGRLNFEKFQTADDVIAAVRTRGTRCCSSSAPARCRRKTRFAPSRQTSRVSPAWIADRIAEADARAPPIPGRVVVRRLNRAEYNNTVRDLLGVDSSPADDFPQDDTGYGFDNDRRRALGLAGADGEVPGGGREVARTAIFGPPTMKPTLVAAQPHGRGRSSRARRSRPITTPPGSPSERAPRHAPLPGRRRVPHSRRRSAARARRARSRSVALWIDGTRVQTTTLDPEERVVLRRRPAGLLGQDVEFRVHLTAGEHWFAVTIPQLYEGLPPSYDGPPSSRPSRRRPCSSRGPTGRPKRTKSVDCGSRRSTRSGRRRTTRASATSRSAVPTSR